MRGAEDEHILDDEYEDVHAHAHCVERHARTDASNSGYQPETSPLHAPRHTTKAQS